MAAGLWENRLIVFSDDPVQPQIAIPLRGVGGQVVDTPGDRPRQATPRQANPRQATPRQATSRLAILRSDPPAGEIPLFSGILVRDSVSPEDDLRLPFGSVPIGVAKRKTIQIINRSENLLIFGTISDLPPFAVENDTCSETELGSQEQCTLDVVFIPTAAGEVDTDLVIDSSFSTDGRITVALSGLGVPASDYFPAPVLIHPLDGQINLKDSVLLRWYNCRDAAGNMASYRVSSHQSPPVADVQSNLEGRSALHLGFGLAALFLLWPAAAENRKVRRWFFLLLAASFLMVACSEDIEDSSTATIGGLEGKSTYNWQVIAEYEDGIETPSEVRSFTTR